jgi:hypothetical protein
MMYVQNTSQLLEAFENNQPNRTISSHTINTVTLPNGNIALLSYDWARIAEITNNGDVLVFEGHYDTTATTDNHINRVKDYFGDKVVTMSSKPVDGPVPETIEYAGNYVGGFDNLSPIEQNAHESVRTQMKRRLKSRQ